MGLSWYGSVLSASQCIFSPRSIFFRCYVCVDDMGDRHVKFGGCSYGPTCYVSKKDFLWNAMRIWSGGTWM